MSNVLAQAPTAAIAAVMFALGALLGRCLAPIVRRLSDDFVAEPSETCDGCGGGFRPLYYVPILGYLLALGRCRNCGRRLDSGRLFAELCSGMLFAGYCVAYLRFNCQQTDEVRPDDLWFYGRIVFHLILITLLVAATGTDLRAYIIPDHITVTGMIIGVTAATVSGDLQTIHLWVDWNVHIPQLRGADMPVWIREHHHWHGLAWSLTGLVVGGAMTWLARIISTLVLGQEAMGFGDVTLMAMIGSFLGWQPVVFVFLLAPFCGMLVAVAVKLFMNKPYVPYGPFLSAATIIVLMSWKWLWMWEPSNEFSVRRLFGDGRSLVYLGVIAFVALGALLGLLRLYRMIPGKQREG